MYPNSLPYRPLRSRFKRRLRIASGRQVSQDTIAPYTDWLAAYEGGDGGGGGDGRGGDGVGLIEEETS